MTSQSYRSLTRNTLRAFGIVLALSLSTARAAPPRVVSSAALANAVAQHRANVPEFQFIREQANALGIRVWLFGGTAAGYGHYAKWDLQRKSGDARFQSERFDYDYTNIFRSTQDADLVIDGPPEAAEKLTQALARKFPHLQGSKSAWEIRLLKQSLGAKDALLGNPDYLNQHTDSNSTGMIELTDPPVGESVIRDLRDWKSPEPVFLKDLAEGKLHYYISERHHETKRAQAGDNPEIFSAVRLLTKAFQYELTLRPEDWAQVQAVIDRFDPKRDLKTPYSQAWLEKNAKKLIQHAVNIEYAWNTLERLGLRTKLISIKNDVRTQQSLAWWLSKEPLRDQALGTQGRTAREVFATASARSATAPIVLAHETNTFLAYESITRAHTGDPNILISRNGYAGESAALGDGFYTRMGREGARGTGRTIRFTLDPNAREGEDFTRPASDYVVILNKRAIRVIPESLNMTIPDYFRMLAEGKAIDPSDRGILEKLKRRMNTKVGNLRTEEAEEIFSMVESQLSWPQEQLSETLFSEFFSLTPGIGQRDRVNRIVDTLIERNQAETLRIVNRGVLTQAWSASHLNWFLAVARSRLVDAKTLVQETFTIPHWRNQLPALEAMIERKPDVHSLITQILLPFWKERPEFSKIILRLIEAKGFRTNIVVSQYFLKNPEYADRFDWLEAILRQDVELGDRSPDSIAIFGCTLDHPHWANQARAVQLAIDLQFQPDQLVTQVLVPHWQERAEFDGFISQLILTKNPLALKGIFRQILTDPRYAHRFDWLEAVLRSSTSKAADTTKSILMLPHWRQQAKVVRLAIELNHDLPGLTQRVLLPHWKDRPEFPEFVAEILRKGDPQATLALGEQIRSELASAQPPSCLSTIQTALREAHSEHR